MITPHNKYTVSEVKKGDYVIQVNSNNYLVGEVIFQILKKNLESYSKAEIFSYLKENYEDIDVNQLDTIIEENITPLFKITDQKQNNNPVKSVMTVFNPEKFQGLLKILSVFFSTNFFWKTFIILTVVNLVFLSNTYHVSNLNTSENMYNWIYVFLFTIALVLIHEFGHVASAYKYGVLTKEVGFGFYFVYPAFYTNLSEVWRLDKFKRTIINLSGVHFQLVVGVFLMLLSFFFKSHSELIYHMFYSNLLIIFFNINPLFKFDGYWIFSDWFEFYNLRDLSQQVVLSFFGKAKFPTVKKNQKALLILYSILYSLFMIFIWFTIFKYLIRSSTDLYELISLHEKFVFNGDFIKKIIWFIVTFYLSMRIIVTNSKNIKKLL